ncbi:Zn-dependent exopeptidase [Cubamyces sp. BRFM 1775]|nr:Zn-dependent exopeptidase [Cubamyces sp. BRFM 1775]
MRFSGLAPYSLLLVSLRDLPLQNGVPAAYTDCLGSSYYGIYGARRAFVLDQPCLLSSFSLMQLGTIVRLQERDGENLVWLEHRPMDPSLVSASFDSELDSLLWKLRNPSVIDVQLGTATHGSQIPLQPPPRKELTVLHRTHDGALLSASDAALRALDTQLPTFWRYTPFPASPLPLIPVPPRAKERLREALATIRFNHIVAAIVNGISVHHLQKDVRHLTGEDPASTLATRHSFSEDAPRAAAWLKAQFEALGAECELKHFQEGFAPNVICKYTGSEETTETLVLGAHYDDRGSFGEVRAPGANDDASGTAALLGIARAIVRRGVVFKANVLFCAFAGEEQGMIGSKAYAKELREQGANITLMIQADMLAYRKPGDAPQLGLSDPALVGTPELTQILANVSAIYSPELTVGHFPYPGGSDHRSFHEQGFPAVQVYERADLIADPMYHNSGDLSDREGYDFEQIKSIAKVELATILHVAGFDWDNVDEPEQE